jgi:hypothetical protein
VKYLLHIPYDKNLKFASFDITNMYTKIPTNKLPVIIQKTLYNKQHKSDYTNRNYTPMWYYCESKLLTLQQLILSTKQNRISSGRPYLLDFFQKYIYNT